LIEVERPRAEGVLDPAGHVARQIGRRFSICGGGRQAGHSRFMVTLFVPAQVNPCRPTPTP
jgi:hypothetical protein